MELIDWKGVYSKQPPPFGHALKQYYAVDPELLYLNNGKDCSKIYQIFCLTYSQDHSEHHPNQFTRPHTS